jgi:superfamily I DNA/RNA helicase
MKKIRIAGPPGTGKTTKLVEIYYNHLEEYSPTQIMIISHTNTAAENIRHKITDIETIQKYEDDTGKKLLQVIKNSKETLKENVSTIHKFCKDRLEKGLAFNMDDYENLKIQKPKFNKYTTDKQFYNVSLLVTSHPFFKFISMARDNGKDILPYYRSLTEEEKADYQYLPEELVEMSKQYKDFKTNKKINGREGRLLDFQDMVEEFCENEEMSVASCRNIKVLIVDEAQDSSVIQRKAEEIMSRNVDYFYKAGDPDQSIFEFAGADPDSFHREFADPEIELKEGYRCPRVINEYCKKIISPIWEHYGYERTWKPREELDEKGNRTGVVVEGEMYYLSDLAQDPFASELKNRILNTKESFIFTFRGGDPTQIINYLTSIGMPMKIAKEDQKTKFKYPAQMIKNQRAYIDFVSGKEVTIPQLKKFMNVMKDDYVLKTTEDLDKQVEKGTYNIDWFIDNKYVLPGIKNTNDFQILIKDYPHKNIETKNYVREIVNKNRDLEDHRVFVENIHTIKGKEFDNVVFDFRLTRDEEMFTKKRLKFVACSRAKKTLWILKSKSALSFTGKEDL